MTKRAIYVFVFVLIATASIILAVFMQNASNSNKIDNNKTQTVDWTIPFGDKIVIITRLNSGKIEDTFWGKSPSITKDPNETIDTIYSKYPNIYNGLVYNSNTKQYYFLGPSSYQSISISSRQELDLLSQINSKSRSDKDSDVTIINNREEIKEEKLLFNKNWKAIKYSDFHVFTGTDVTDNNNWLSDGSTTVCYLPINGTEEFLVFDEPMHSTGTEVNMCEYINLMGIQSAKTK
jgi:hypothetical protein